MTRILTLALALGLATLMPRTAAAAEAGDAVFTERGPWDLGTASLEWRMTVTGPAAEGFRPSQGGTITLSQVTDPSDQQPVLELRQKTGPIDRRIGPFPISSGDPVLTFFLEQTTRDMAALTGGSPYYIRNRLKDALFRGGDIGPSEGGGMTASFQPFADDPNAERMGGFQSLELSFVMDDPNQPIRQMRAATDATPGYLNELVME